MKRFFTAIVCAFILNIGFSAMATVYPTNRQIKKVDWDNMLILACFNDGCTDFWKISYKPNAVPGVPFPAGTRAKAERGRVFYQLKGQDPDQWTEIRKEMIVEEVYTQTAATSDSTVFPSREDMPGPSAIVSDFETGTNIIDPNNPKQMKDLFKMYNDMTANKDLNIVWEGGASRDTNNWSCYYTDDFRYFREESKHNAAAYPNASKATGADVCNEYLSYSRARAAAEWLIAKGISRNRVHALKFATYGNRKDRERLANQYAIGFLISDNQIVISNPTTKAPEPKNCPDCPEVKIRYEIPENCGYIEKRQGNDVLVQMLCVIPEPKIITVPGNCPNCPTGSSVIPPYERGDDLGWWIGIGGAGGLGAGFAPTGGDGGDGGDGGSNGGSGENGENGSAATVCNGDIGCFIATTVGGMAIGWAGYEIKEACRKAKYERQVKAQQKAQQAQQPATQPAPDPKR